MSPAFFDCRSPIPSTTQSQSTQPPSSTNPSPSLNEIPNFSSFASSLNDSTSFNSSHIGTTTDRVLNYSLPSHFESGVSSEKPKVLSSSSSRTRPRLVKVRKQFGAQNVRSKSINENSNVVRGGVDARNFSSGEFGKFNDCSSEALNSNLNNTVNVAFGDNNKCNMVSNSNCGNRRTSVVDESVKFGNVSFGLGDRESGGKVGNLDSNGFTKFSNLGFAPYRSMSKSSFDCDAEEKEPTEDVRRYHVESKKIEKETKLEFRKLDNVDFVFGTNKKDSSSHSKLEKKESDASFVFSAGGSDLRPSFQSERVEANGSVGNAFSCDFEDMAFKSKGRNLDKLGFVFGANMSNPTNVHVEIQDSKGSAEQSNMFDKGKKNKNITLEHENSKVDGVFIFESCSKGSLHSSSHHGDKNKLGFEKAANGNGEVKGDGNITGTTACNTSNFLFGQSDLSNAFGRSQGYKLSDEMQRMNIDDSEKVDRVDSYKDSYSSSFADFNVKFGFESDKKASPSVFGSSGFTSHQFQNADAADSHNGPILQVGRETSEDKVFAIGKSEKNVSSFGESMENTIPDVTRNRVTTFGSGLFTGHNISVCSSSGILGKENRPIDLTSTDGKQVPGNPPNLDTQVNELPSPSSSSVHFGFQPYDSVNEAPVSDRVEKINEGFTFSSTPVQFGETFTGSDTPNLNNPTSLFSGPGKKLNFSVNNRSAGGRRLKKTKGKVRQNIASREYISPQNEADCGSPMDFSPYQESNCASSNISAKAAAEDFVAAKESSDIEEEDKKSKIPNERSLKDHSETEQQINSRTERIDNNVFVGIASVETSAFHSNTEREGSDSETQYCFSSTSKNHVEGNFSFAASSSVQNNLSATNRKSIKKYRMKIGYGSDSAASSLHGGLSGNSSQSDELQDQRANMFTQNKVEHTLKADEKQMKENLTEAAALEACEKLRIRGNQAYRKGSLLKAENLYTKCINSIKHSETPECSIQPLVLCYSNHAATLMSLGRIREALRDCKTAASLDPDFRKVQMRAANCHLLLGEVEDAMLYFSNCLESGVDVCLDRRIMIEAADGLQKSKKVIECLNQAAGLLQQRTSDAANDALIIITEALSISCYSEKLLKIKGEALLMLRKYEEVVQICEQTLGFAEKNFASINPANHFSSMDGCEGNNLDVKGWRWKLISKSYFHMGRLEASLDLIRQHEQLESVGDKHRNEEKDTSTTLAATIRELIHLKNAGNKAFQCGKHTEAIEHYTAAISSSVHSRPFAAVCFCNRAAAHQALGEMSDAIADCSLAIALDANYGKALSRRATLHELIRDYEQAANDLQRYISVLVKQSQETYQESETPRGTVGSREHLREARGRLSSVERKAKKETPLDFYLLLGIKTSDTASDIKKAYRRAALKHHPDKAGQFLARAESGDGGLLRKEITDKIHADAGRLFKMIGEAYTVLSDDKKRGTYDLEEEIRNQKDNNINGSSGRDSNVYRSPFESRSGRDNGREWRTYGSD